MQNETFPCTDPTEAAQTYTLRMSSADCALVRKSFEKQKRVPTPVEWRLLDELVVIRRGRAYAYTLAPLSDESGEAARTLADLREKRRAMGPGWDAPLTLAETAEVAADYLAMIGREDRVSPLVPSRSLSEEVLTVFSEDGSPLLSLGKAEATQSESLPAGTALLLLTASEAESYGEALTRLLHCPERALLALTLLSVGDFGILGTLAHLPGVTVDLTALPCEGVRLDPLAAVRDFHGCTILALPRAHVPYLRQLSARYGLRASYLAKVTPDGNWKTVEGGPLALTLDCSLLRRLMEGSEPAAAPLPTENPRLVRQSLSLEYRLGEETRPLPEHLPYGGYLLSSVASRGETAPFHTAMNTAIDALLRAVSRGADRRHVGLSFAYTFPERETDPSSLGKDLALILGAYRVSMELAAPEPGASVRFGTSERMVLCTAYTPSAEHPLPTVCHGGGTKLCFLPLRRTAQGEPDFESLREICDAFLSLHRKGKLLSARALSGDPVAVAREMADGKSLLPTDLWHTVEGSVCQGFLVETKAASLSSVLAEIGEEKEI